MIKSLWSKYAGAKLLPPLKKGGRGGFKSWGNTNEAERDAASEQLKTFLLESGYDVHDCMDTGGRAMSGTIAEDAQVPRAQGCAGAAE